jgi:succinoglycan biosynthesis transport protein ExoP
VDDRVFDLRALVGVLRRQARLMAITMLVVLAGSSAALFSLKQQCTATLLVLVDPSHKDLLDPNPQTGSSASEAVRIAGEVELVRSPATLLNVVEKEKLLEDPEFAGPGALTKALTALRLAPASDAATQQRVLDKLADSLRVERRDLTHVISIGFISANPATAARLANAIADAYIRDQVSSKINSATTSRDILQGRLANARGAIVGSEKDFDAYISQNIEALASQTGNSPLVGLKNQLAGLHSRNETLQANIAAADTCRANKHWLGVAKSLQSEALKKLTDRQATLQRQLDAAAGGTVASGVKAQLAALDAQLDETAAQEIGTLRQKISASEAEAISLRQQMRSAVVGQTSRPRF